MRVWFGEEFTSFPCKSSKVFFKIKTFSNKIKSVSLEGQRYNISYLGHNKTNVKT